VKYWSYVEDLWFTRRNLAGSNHRAESSRAESDVCGVTGHLEEIEKREPRSPPEPSTHGCAEMTEVLSAPGNGRSHFLSSSLHRSSSHSLIGLDTPNRYLQSSKSSYTHSEYGNELSASAPSSAPSSPLTEHHAFSRPSSYTSTPASSLSLDTKADLAEDEDEDIPFPLFEAVKSEEHNLIRVVEPESYVEEDSSTRHDELQGIPSSDLPLTVHDDQAVEDQPTRHVDYLSHEWKEEDIWSSWRYIVARRHVYNNSVRLENASWRTWTKAKYKLKTVSPEALNWYVLGSDPELNRR
jgi:hypothetical protein